MATQEPAQSPSHHHPLPSPSQEMHSFLKTSTHTEMIVDRSAHGELLRVNFDLSFPRMSCEFATLDISDAMGLKRLNLTKTVRKVPLNDRLERVGLGLEDAAHHNPEYDEEHPVRLAKGARVWKG